LTAKRHDSVVWRIWDEIENWCGQERVIGSRSVRSVGPENFLADNFWNLRALWLADVCG
jgi:hypothetical protein